MTQRDAVDVAADVVKQLGAFCDEYAAAGRVSAQEAMQLMSEAIVALDKTAEALRSASNSGAEAMREAGVTMLLDMASARYELAMKWLMTDEPESAAQIAAHNALSLAAGALRELPLPAPGAPASPWRSMGSAPKDGRPFLILTSYAPNPVHEASWEKEADAFLFADGTICTNAIGWMPMPLPTPHASKDT